MRITVGTTNQGFYFLPTLAGATVTGLPVTAWAVEYSKEGATSWTDMTTPTITEIENGAYWLLCDEGMTMTAGNHSEAMMFRITDTGAGVDPTFKEIELYVPDVTEGETLGVASDGDLLEVNTVTGHTAQTADHTAGIADVPTVAEFNARTLVAASYFDPAADAVANVTLVATTTAATDAEADIAALNDAPAVSAAIIADAVWDELQAAHVIADSFGVMATELAAIPTTAMRGTDNAATEAKQDIMDTNVDQIEAAVITNATGTDIAADIIAMKAETVLILADTDDIGVAGAGLTNLGASGNDWNTVTPDAAGVAPTAAEIETEVWDGLQSAHVIADSMGAMATELALIPTTAMRGTDNAATGAKQDTMETTLNAAATTAALATAQTDLDTITGTSGVLIGTDAANVTEISDAVWDEDQSGHVGANTFGVLATEIAALQTDLDTLTAGVTLTAGSVDAIWDEDVVAAHGTADTAGKKLNDAGSGASAATIADAVWDELQAAHVISDSFGVIATEIAAIPTTAMRGTDNAATEAKQDIIDTNVDQIETAVITNATGTDIAADIIALKAETVLIVADTNELQTDDIPGKIVTLDAVVDTVKAETVLILADTGELQVDSAAGNLGVDVDKINGAVITGDGSATPFDVA